MGGFTPLDSRARTNIGDIGGALLAGIKSEEFRNEFYQSNTNHDRILEILNRYFIQGLFLKYDVDANIDSYAINRMLSNDPNLIISEALRKYYKTNNVYYNTRFTEFGENEFDMRLEGNNIFINIDKAYDFNDQVISFAFALRANNASNCNILGIPQPYCQLLFGSGGQDTGSINFYSMSYTEGFVNSIACLAQEEQGIKQCDRPN
jgi:hypothetical protein